MYVLTEEGIKYLKRGLPEKRLIALLKEKNGLLMKDATKELGREFAIALQWCKKYKCVNVVDGNMMLSKDLPKEATSQENALKEIASGREPESCVLQILIQRKLAEKESEGIVKQAEKFVGKEITSLNTELIKTGMWRKVKLRPYNVEA